MSDESSQLRVRLVTPERTLFDHPATAVELPSKSGHFEVLYGHAPLMAALGAGDVTVPPGVGIESNSPGTILASDALKPEEIDVPRAQQQLDRGHKMWNEAGESEDAYTDALRVISEAEAKIASASEKH